MAITIVMTLGTERERYRDATGQPIGGFERYNERVGVTY